jgi:hypothetical protein
VTGVLDGRHARLRDDGEEVGFQRGGRADSVMSAGQDHHRDLDSAGGGSDVDRDPVPGPGEPGVVARSETVGQDLLA